MLRLGESKIYVLIIVSVSMIIFSGCTDKKTAELQRYIDTIKNKPAHPIEPLPTFKRHEKFTYLAVGLRDPFTRAVRRSAGGNSNVRPDLARPKEPLEAFTLDSLSMSGILTEANKTWALVAAPDETLYRVKVGSYLGQNYGKIVAIHKKSIDIIETMPQGDGWVERPTILTLKSG